MKYTVSLILAVLALCHGSAALGLGYRFSEGETAVYRLVKEVSIEGAPSSDIIGNNFTEESVMELRASGVSPDSYSLSYEVVSGVLSRDGAGEPLSSTGEVYPVVISPKGEILGSKGLNQQLHYELMMPLLPEGEAVVGDTWPYKIVSKKEMMNFVNSDIVYTLKEIKQTDGGEIYIIGFSGSSLSSEKSEALETSFNKAIEGDIYFDGSAGRVSSASSIEHLNIKIYNAFTRSAMNIRSTTKLLFEMYR